MLSDFNRTIIELKQPQIGHKYAVVHYFNRTIIELKPFDGKNLDELPPYFNRTIIELKLFYNSEDEVYATIILIAL